MSSSAAEYRVCSADQIANLTGVQPGDEIILTNGMWLNQRITFAATGTSKHPITLRAETPGEVLLTGESSVTIGGEYVFVSGISLTNGHNGDGILINGSHNRLTDCAVTDSAYKFFVHLFGVSNRMDHCYLAGKTSESPTLQIEVGSRPNHHLIDHNDFGPRPPLHRNGGETMRVGYSWQSMSNSCTTVEHNLFDRCDGEIEIISSKSCENIYRFNTFLDCAGMLTLRHGNRCLVEGNFFIGHNKRGSGGIRVIGEDHTIIDNYIDGVRQGGFWITAGIPDSELKGYFQARNCLIAFNTVIDSDGPCVQLDAGMGSSGRSLRPENITIANNLFLPSTNGVLFRGTEGRGFRWLGNVTTEKPSTNSQRARILNPKMQRGEDGLWRPAADSSLRHAAVGGFAQIGTDMDGQRRPRRATVGSDEISDAPATNHPLTPNEVGPSWMRNNSMSANRSDVTISVDTKSPEQTITSDFEGLSFEVALLSPNKDGVHYFRRNNRPLIQLFHTLGIKSLRIGGNTSDRDARHLPTTDDLDSLFTFAKAAGVKVIYCLQLHNGDPQVAAQTVKYVMDHYARQMDCFSIGQEPSAYPVEKKDTRPATERMGATAEKYQYSTYREDWKRFADVIIAAVPNVRLCGPSVHNNGEWARRFMSDFGKSNNVALITEHLYPGSAGNRVPTPEIGRDRMLSSESSMTNNFPKAYQKLYDSFVPMAISNSLPYRLEEVNNYFNGGATNVSNTFASALWGLDFMYWWASHDAAGINFHTGDRVAAGNSLQPSKYTAFFTTTNGYLVRPLGYGIKAFELGSHGKFLPASISSDATNLNLNAYAVLGTDRSIYVTLINKEHGENAQTLNVTIDADSYTRGSTMFLTTSNNDVSSTTDVRFGGATIERNGTWKGKWTKLPRTDSRFIKVNLSPASAAVIKLTR